MPSTASTWTRGTRRRPGLGLEATLDRRLRVDSFTQVPHALCWLTEQKPLARGLGGELELRLMNYRDTTPHSLWPGRRRPLRRWGGDGSPVDVVDAALTATYGDPAAGRVVALTPQGRQLDQAVVEGSRRRRAGTALVAIRGLRRADRHALSTDTDLDRPLRAVRRRAPRDGLLDAIARRIPGRWQRVPGSSRASRRRSTAARVPAIHAPRGLSRLGRPDVLLSGDHGRIESWRREQSRERSTT